MIRAVGNGHAETVEVLIKHGADVNAKNNNRKAALIRVGDFFTIFNLKTCETIDRKYKTKSPFELLI